MDDRNPANEMRAARDNLRDMQNRMKDIDSFDSTEIAMEKTVEYTTGILVDLLDNKSLFRKKSGLSEADINFIADVWDVTAKRHISREKDVNVKIFSRAIRSTRSAMMQIASEVSNIGYSEFNLFFFWNLEKNCPGSMDLGFSLKNLQGEVVGEPKTISIVFSNDTYNQECINTVNSSKEPDVRYLRSVAQNGNVIVYKFLQNNSQMRPQALKFSAIGDIEVAGQINRIWISQFLA